MRAGFGEELAVRRYTVESRREVALERQCARAGREEAARRGGRDDHEVIEGGREAVGAVVDDP